jgi:hypothetical protein
MKITQEIRAMAAEQEGSSSDGDGHAEHGANGAASEPIAIQLK